MTQKISVIPASPGAGQPFQVCYSFDPDEPGPVTLDLNWTPSQAPGGVVLTPGEPCATVLADSAAEELRITGGGADPCRVEFH